MVPLIFSNTLLLPYQDAQEAAAITLMSTDIDRISFSLEQVMEIWARSVEIAIGTWLLARQLGWVSFAPLVVIGGKFHIYPNTHKTTVDVADSLS